MALVDANEIQALIDRLQSLKKRHVELIDEQIELSHRLAETVAQNEQARAYLAVEQDRWKREHDKSRRAGG